jgi:hypothetical protein
MALGVTFLMGGHTPVASSNFGFAKTLTGVIETGAGSGILT